MSASGAFTSHDFRSPSSLPKHLDERLHDWARGICQFTVDRWNEFCQVPLEMSLKHMSSQLLSEARTKMTVEGMGYPCLLPEVEATTLFLLSRQTALGLVDRMLGELTSELPEDGPMTTVQHSLLDLWFEQLVDSVARAWPLQHPISAEPGKCDDRPQRTKLFPPYEPMLLIEFAIACQFPPQPLYWLLAVEELQQGPLNQDWLQGAPSEDSRQKLRQCVREVPVELVVRLGESKLSMSELATLTAGDVIVLDQRISDPLPASVGEIPTFWGWPGRMGVRQAFQITKST